MFYFTFSSLQAIKTQLQNPLQLWYSFVYRGRNFNTDACKLTIKMTKNSPGAIKNAGQLTTHPTLLYFYNLNYVFKATLTFVS